jgi:hypothetical protein
MRWVAVEKRRRLAKPKRIREGERIYNVPRRLSKEELERIHAKEAHRRRIADAHARTLFEFGRHRGTRLSLSLLEHRAVPSTRK